MTQPQGLQGLRGFVIADPFATAAERQGGMADPGHANVGEQAEPYPYEEYPGEPHGPYGAESQLLGMDVFSVTLSAGKIGDDPTMDEQPLTRAAPWPKGVPQSIHPDKQYLEYREQLADIHASNMGGSREMQYLPTADAVQDQWVEQMATDPGLLFPQMEPLPAQMMTGGSGGFGSRDRIHSFAEQNEYGFDSAHMHRRFAVGSIPGNSLWMRPGSRPLIKTVAGTARIPYGEGPFMGQDGSTGYDPQGSALAVLPKAYEPPPDPALADSYPSFTDTAPAVPLW